MKHEKTNNNNIIDELAINDKTANDVVARVDVGSTLKNRFVLEELLASGGMGSIYKARDLRKEEAKDRNSFIAVKVLSEDFRYHPEAFVALQRESRRMQDLSHPNIISVYDFDRDGDIVFMTMEYLQGITLDKIIKNPAIELSTDRALHIAADVAAALERSHQQGVIHSDLKPSNIFITNEGTVKLFDFGIARSVKRDPTLTGDVTQFDAASLSAFTPAYASYEMLQGQEPDARDDVYALACIVYEMLERRHPYDRESAQQAVKKGLTPSKPKHISQNIWKRLQKGLAISAIHRPHSAKAFIDGLIKPELSWFMRLSIIVPTVLAIMFFGLFVYEWHVEHHMVEEVQQYESSQ